LSVHIPGIEDLVKHHGYRRLKDLPDFLDSPHHVQEVT